MDDLKKTPELTDVLEDDFSKSRRKKSRKRVLTILFVSLNIVIIGGTAYIDFTKERMPSVSLGNNMVFLFAAAGCFIIAITAESLKFYIMMHRLNGSASVRMAFEVATLGKYYDSITPTGAGGQPFQVYYLRKNNVSTGASAAMPIAGFLTLQFAFILLAIAVFIFGTPFLNMVPDYSVAIRITAIIGIVFYAALPLLIVLFVVFPKAAGAVVRFFIMLLATMRIIKEPEGKLEKSLVMFDEYRQSIVIICKKKHMLLMLIGFGIIYHIALCSIPYFVLRAFGSTLMYRSVFAMMVLIYCAITYIPTPGNSGAAEASFFVLLASLNQDHLFWAMLIWRFFTYYAFLAIGCGIFTFKAIEKRLDKNKSNA